MAENLFQPTLISGDNVQSLGAGMRAALKDKSVTLKVHWKNGRPEVIPDLFLSPGSDGNGVCVKHAKDRGTMTNSHHLGFVFKSHAFAFETRDDPLFERLSDNCFRITNQRTSEGENPVVEIVFSF